VADGGERFLLFGKVAYYVKRLLVQADVLRRAAAGDRQRVIVFGLDLVKGGIQP
jgi:hypothetical protein